MMPKVISISPSVGTLDKRYVKKSGDTMTGNLTFNNASILEPNYIDFNTAYNTPLAEGQLGYNSGQGELQLGLAGGNVQVAVGKELVLPKRVRNSSGTTMTKGTVVYISGVSGNTPVVSRAIATSDATSAFTIGLTAEDIDDGSTGWVIFTGELSGLNLAAYNAGDTVYLSGTTAGQFTNVIPSAPIHYVRIGIVTKATASGDLLVNIINGFELQELHNVAINQGTLANNNIIAWNSSTNLWENKAPNTVLTAGNLTESTSSVLTISGGTGAVLGSGTSIQVKQASGSQSGFLSSTDWTTFNNKQATISVSDTSSVDLTFTSNTLSATVLPAGVNHNSLANLTTGDPHTQYALLAGRSGGQTLNGGTAASNNLTLVSTSNATKGKILFGTSAYDEVNNRLGIGFDAPLTTIHARSSAFTAIRSETTATNNYAQFDLVSSTRRYSMGIGGSTVSDGVADDWYLYDAIALAYRLAVNTSGNLGIGTVTPVYDVTLGNGTDRRFAIEPTASGSTGKFLRVGGGDTTAGTANIAGGTLFLESGMGTGTGGSSIVFRTGPSDSVNTTALQTQTEAMRINNTQDVLIGTTSSSAGSRLRMVKTITPTASGVSNGFLAEITIDSSSTTGIDARTFNLFLTTTGANNVTSQWGSFVNASNNLDSGKTVTNHYAYGASPRIIGAGASANMGGFYAEPLIQATGSGAVTSYYAFRSVPINYAVGATTTFTNTYGVYLGALYNATYSSNAWGVYQAGSSDKNYFAGFTGFGTQTAPAAPIDVISATPSAFRRDNAAIAAIHNYYNRNTTNSNGINWTFYSDTSGVGAATNQIFGQWDLRFDQHDHATRSSTALFRNYVAGASNIWLWAGSNGKVGINTATGPTDDFTVNGETRIYGGAYNSSTTNIGMYLGVDASSQPGVMFANGTAAENWQIINSSGRVQFNIGFATMAQISKVSGLNSGIFTLYSDSGEVHFSTQPSYILLGREANYDIQFVAATAAGTPGKSLTITANDTTSGTGSSNTAGGSLILNAGLGTGTGSSNFIVKTGQTVGVATTGQTITTRLTIDNAGLWTLWDGTTINLGTTTGTKIGTATTQKLGFFNATPVVRPTAYTQTFSTADKTMAARTAAALTDNTGGTVSTTLAAITAGATYAQADMTAVKNAIASLADQVNKSRNDSVDIASIVNAVIDDLQALGLVG